MTVTLYAVPPAMVVGKVNVVALAAGLTESEPFASVRPVAVSPVSVPPRWYLGTVQVTCTVLTALLTVPVPFATTHAAPVGCVAIVTAYDDPAVTAVGKVKVVAPEARVSLSDPLASTRPLVDRPLMVPPTEYDAGAAWSWQACKAAAPRHSASTLSSLAQHGVVDGKVRTLG